MTVNEMIIEAITTDSRKRKARYQTELEALGYKVYKDRAWIIRNPKTGRFIDLGYNEQYVRTNNGCIKFGSMWSRKKGRYVIKPIDKINFVGLLNKKEVERNYFENDTTVSSLKRALHDRKYHKKNLDNAMAEYQTKIDAITQEYKRMLKDAENSYKWSVEYHTNALKRSENEITKLLCRSIDN